MILVAISSGQHALLKRLRHKLGQFKRKGVFFLARIWRNILGRTNNLYCVGVTGSCGKTGTKELVAKILSTKNSGIKSDQFFNNREGLARTILTLSPWHRYYVHELGTQEPGMMADLVDLFQPQVGVVTHIGHDHYTTYRGKQNTAREKGVLVESLPASGTAILNADDEYVLAMRHRTRAQVVTYGISENTMVRGINISSNWPDRLSLDVSYQGATTHIQTQLLGTHWTSSVLAAVATGLVSGISLTQCAQAIKEVAPYEGRLSVHKTPGDITFIRDDVKAPLWTVPAALAFMQAARAPRRVAIIGTISDKPGSSSPKYRATAKQALEAAEKVIFVGPQSHYVLKGQTDVTDQRLMAFDTLYELNLYLADYLLPGDLVLLKGSIGADHLQRLVLARTGDIQCWQESCGKYMFCANCSLRDTTYLPSDTKKAT